MYEKWTDNAPLFIPISKADKYLQSAYQHGAVTVIFDLEDSEPDKDAARLLIAKHVANQPPMVNVGVRINRWPSDEAVSDIYAIKKCRPDFLVIPKITTSETIHELDAILNSEKGVKPIKFLPLFETAYSFNNAQQILTAKNICALAYGDGDLLADLQSCLTDITIQKHAHQQLPFWAAQLKIPALGGVNPDYTNKAEIENQARYDWQQNYQGKLCIHPSQIASTSAVMQPTEKDIQWAQNINNAENGVYGADGTMIGPPQRRIAQNIITRYNELREIRARRESAKTYK